MAVSSLVELLQLRARERGDFDGFRYLSDGVEADLALTWAQLDRRARAIGATLQSRFPSGSRVLLIFPPGLEFLEALFGCMYGGMIGVPLPLISYGGTQVLANLIALALLMNVSMRRYIF